jgi:hypothetical protein
MHVTPKSSILTLPLLSSWCVHLSGRLSAFPPTIALHCAIDVPSFPIRPVRPVPFSFPQFQRIVYALPPPSLSVTLSDENPFQGFSCEGVFYLSLSFRSIPLILTPTLLCPYSNFIRKNPIAFFWVYIRCAPSETIKYIQPHQQTYLTITTIKIQYLYINPTIGGYSVDPVQALA